MTSVAVPEHHRRFPYRERPFDLRATAMFFGISAVVLIVVGLVARAAVDVAERRPAWAAVLSLVGIAILLAWRRNRRRMSVVRLARRTTEALEEATATALDALETAEPAGPPQAAPHRAGVCAAGTAVPRRDEGVRTGDEGGLLEATAVLDYAVLDYAALSADEFEQAIADLCVRDGCSRVEVVGGAGDLGADVVALAPDGRRVVIQCKRYGEDNKVGSQELQRFGGTCFTVHEADVAVIVTTSDFTAPAEEYAEQCGIVCVNHEGLRAWSDGLAVGPWAPGPRGGAA
ncbi:restriction endonuclease [Streptomyces sp. NPDC052701]|uniref:restriction endonuclease n=1 Tax=Streptomyces sp. NPDC052701 TaxID=3155533 RepID=UPI003441B7B6